MSSVLFGNTGYSGVNALRNELRGLQNQINSMKQDNQFLVAALTKTNPDAVTEMNALKAAAAAAAEAQAQAAAQDVARQRMVMQSQNNFNRR